MLSILIALVVVSAGVFPQEVPSGASIRSRRMQDGKEWTAANLEVKADDAYCYDDAELNCRRYGRLYTWRAAQRACRSLGPGWRLPTDEDWRRLATHWTASETSAANAWFYNFGKGGQSLNYAVFSCATNDKAMQAARVARFATVAHRVRFGCWRIWFMSMTSNAHDLREGAQCPASFDAGSRPGSAVRSK